jgi:hypothetical protein
MQEANYNNVYERDIINIFNDREILNRQARMTSEGVNNIVAAFFIKSIQHKRNNIKPVETIIHREEVCSEQNNANNIEVSNVNNINGNNKMFTDIQSDLGGFTNNQLNNVNDMMKRITEKDFNK